jgi:serine/threonine-protein kinase RsbW
MANSSSREPHTVVESLDSNLESVDRAEEIAVGAAQGAGFDEDDLMKIGMSVRESMVNAVAHGNRYNAHKKVYFSVRADGISLTITIGDEGEGFDVDSLPDPLAPENLMRTSGRGIFLIRSFMDEVQIRRRAPSGMEVTLVKHAVSK